MSYLFNLIGFSLLIIPIIVVTFFFGKSKCNPKKKFGLALCDVLALAGTIFTLRILYIWAMVPLMILLCVIVPLMIVYGLTIYILIENNKSAQSPKSSNYGSNYTQQ